MGGIFLIIFICFCFVMAYVTYKAEQKEKEKRWIEEQEKRKIEEEKNKKADGLKKRIKIIADELDKMKGYGKFMSKKQLLEDENNKLVDELYELTGEMLSYKGQSAFIFEQTREVKESIKKHKQQEKDKLIQQQIQQKQIEKAVSRAAFFTGVAIANTIHEKNKKEQKQKQQEKELKEMKELLKKLNKK